MNLMLKSRIATISDTFIEAKSANKVSLTYYRTLQVENDSVNVSFV